MSQMRFKASSNVLIPSSHHIHLEDDILPNANSVNYFRLYNLYYNQYSLTWSLFSQNAERFFISQAQLFLLSIIPLCLPNVFFLVYSCQKINFLRVKYIFDACSKFGSRIRDDPTYKHLPLALSLLSARCQSRHIRAKTMAFKLTVILYVCALLDESGGSEAQINFLIYNFFYLN